MSETGLALAQIIKEIKTVALLPHVGPDGDALGSNTAIKGMLQQLPHIEKAEIILDGHVPDHLKFLPYTSTVKNINHENPDTRYDLAITVDCGSKNRLGNAQRVFDTAAYTCNIDHHISNECFAKLNWIDTTAAASGQIVYELINYLGVTLTKDIADALYTTILTDTGGFKYSNTSPLTLRITADLLQAGANFSHIYKLCYENFPYSMFQLHIEALRTCEMSNDKRIFWTTITRDMLNRYGAIDDHVEGIVEKMREINTAEVALIFKETKDNKTKLSFRSETINVCEIAQMFGGGGHMLASGCTFPGSVEQAKEQVMPVVFRIVQDYYSHYGGLNKTAGKIYG